jgi:hypothetical protein
VAFSGRPLLSTRMNRSWGYEIWFRTQHRRAATLYFHSPTLGFDRNGRTNCGSFVKRENCILAGSHLWGRPSPMFLRRRTSIRERGAPNRDRLAEGALHGLRRAEGCKSFLGVRVPLQARGFGRIGKQPAGAECPRS